MSVVASKSGLKLMAAVSVLAMAGAAAAANAQVVYGRAGMAVGAERVSQIARTPTTPSIRDFSKWHGQAGGPVGADAIQHVLNAPNTVLSKDTDFSQWYGRAGGPVGIQATKRNVSDTRIAQTPAGPTVTR
jgi:hypothetical protein